LTHKKFKDKDSFSDQEKEIYTLCKECNTYLTVPTKEINNKASVTWCSFIWTILKDKNIQEKYNDSIWRFIPLAWRPWWINALKTKFPTIFANITLDHPSPVFKDISADIKDWNEDIESYLLSRLKKTCDSKLIPTIKCPWGCSEFIHKVGYVPLDTVFQRYLQKCDIKMISKNDMNDYLISAREDYIHEEGEEDMILLNPEWKVLPSIAFVEGKGPFVLTCAEHDGGTKELYIHPCRWKHNLCSKCPDQLCQAVVNPRLLKPVKASKFSNTFQLFHQTGSFNGIDTCTATSFGKFDFTSHLLTEAEARSIANRPDINAHLSKLKQEGIISEFVEKGKRQFASEYSNSIDYSKYSKGATFVSLENSILLQEEMTNKCIKGTLDHRTDSPPVCLNFNKYWPLCLYPCQNTTNYGIIFPKTPNFHSNEVDTRYIWTLATMLIRVESLWQSVCKVPFFTSQWHGWMLVYLTKNCFNYASIHRQAKNDPFKLRYISSAEKIIDKISLLDERSFEIYMNELNEVYYCEMEIENNEIHINFDDNENVESIQIIIVD